MPFGIIDCKRLEVVPGTACMTDQADLPPDLHDIPTSRLKHGTGKYAHVLLVPQPSDSPNDPLNWPLWKKDLILFIVGFSAAVAGAYGPMLGPGFVPISAAMGISVDTLSHSTAWMVLTLGACVFLTNPLAKMYGKRPVYLVAICLLFAVNVWGALAESYGSFLGSRILGGVGMAPYEVLVQSTIADIYFVHQRATRIAVWTLFLLCGITGASFISGYVIEDLGYHWAFGLCAIMFGASLLAIFFLVPETAYIRPAPATTMARNPSTSSGSGTGGSDEEEVAAAAEKRRTAEHVEHVEDAEKLPCALPPEPKTSYWRTLRPLTGKRYSTAPLWKIMARPFVMILCYPSILWAFLIYGTTLTWIVVFSVVNGVLFTAAPYNFSVSQAGLTGLSPFVLTIVAEIVAGPLNDRLCLFLARCNHGIYEPEFRLALMVLVVPLGAAGFFGFGASVHYQTHWAGPVITYGLANMALGFAGVCVFGYVVDSHPRLAEEAFVAINARNFLTAGVTFFINAWLAREGALRVFVVLGALFLVVCALTLPLWVFGKKVRSWIARNGFLAAFMSDGV